MAQRQEALMSLPDEATMRDIFDFCMKHNLHNLAQGMIELPPPLKLRQIASRMCLENDVIHQYRNRFGEIDYRNSLKSFVKKHYNTDVPVEAILATSGVSGAIYSTMCMLRMEEPQAKVGLIVPFYTYHLKQATDVFGREPIFVETNEDFSPNWDNISKALKDGIKLFLLCNPGNPQATVWKKEDLLKLVQMTSEAKCYLMLDEIYNDLVWEGDFYTPIQDQLDEHVIVCRGFSKSLGCQSWRCGYLISAPQTTAKIMKVHDPVYISVPWQQHAIAEYLEQDYEDFKRHLEELSELMQKNWRVLSVAFQKALGWKPLEPKGSMYGLFLHGKTSDKEAILEGLQRGVGVAPGKIFFPGMPTNTRYVRIHVGISHEKAKLIAASLEAQ